MKNLLILFLLIPNLVFGIELQYIQKNTPAPFTGYLMPPDTEKYFRQISEDLEKQKRIVETYKVLVEMHEGQAALSEKRIQILQEQNLVLIDQQIKLDGNFSKIAMFLLGAGSIILLSYGLPQIRN